MQSAYSLYRNPAQGLSSHDRTKPQAVGAAYSASGLPFHGHLEVRPLKLAFWNIAWTPDSTAETPDVGRLILVDVWDNDRLLAEAQRTIGHPQSSPQTDIRYVTEHLNRIIRDKRTAYLMMKLQAPALVYSSDIMMIWE